MCFFAEKAQKNRQAQKSLSKGLFILRELCYSIHETHSAFFGEDARP